MRKKEVFFDDNEVVRRGMKLGIPKVYIQKILDIEVEYLVELGLVKGV